MDKLQKDRISKLSKKELELELLKIRNYGNPLGLDEQYILKQLRNRREKERQKVKKQAGDLKQTKKMMLLK